jgi:hypothetical protein
VRLLSVIERRWRNTIAGSQMESVNRRRKKAQKTQNSGNKWSNKLFQNL